MASVEITRKQVEENVTLVDLFSRLSMWVSHSSLRL
jgi:hypothetical protein